MDTKAIIEVYILKTSLSNRDRAFLMVSMNSEGQKNTGTGLAIPGGKYHCPDKHSYFPKQEILPNF